MSLASRLDAFALMVRRLFRMSPLEMSDPYVSEVAASIERLADMAELIADGLFAVAAAAHTDTLGNQRNMTAVFKTDAIERYHDVLKKLKPEQRRQLDNFVDNICKGKRK